MVDPDPDVIRTAHTGTYSTMTVTRFSDLPQVADRDDLYRLHPTSGLYYAKRGGLAHAAVDCDRLDPDRMIDNSAWRVASAAECRALSIGWCTDCC
jgi:hypothetical protein